MPTPANPIFACARATLRRFGAPSPTATATATATALFPALTLTLDTAHRWAIIGPVASGKTTLGEALCGHHALHPSAHWHSWDGHPALLPSDIIGMVSFKEDSRSFGYAGRTVQDRYFSREDPDDLTLHEYLLGLPSRHLRTADVCRQETSSVAAAPLPPLLRDLMRALGVDEPMLALKMLRLSNGQTRRARIVKALGEALGVVGNTPGKGWRMVVLDEPFMGLDVSSRDHLASVLASLPTLPTPHPHGPIPLLLLRPQDALPPWITHVLGVERCRVVFKGARSDWDARERVRKVAMPPPKTRSVAVGEPVVEMKEVTVVAVDGGKILDGVEWTVRKGERWVLAGPNGSGKTTLLALLVGDHPQSFSNDIRLFGRRRGTGESLWDIKRRIGHVSPELHLHFTSSLRSQFPLHAPTAPPSTSADPVARAYAAAHNRPVTFLDVVASGLDEAGRVRRIPLEAGGAALPATVEGEWAAPWARDRAAAAAADEVGREVLGEAWVGWRGRGFLAASTGEQRVGLVLRALVRRPPLVILDEPFQGLDEELVAAVHKWLRTGLRDDQALVLVSHHVEEVPADVVGRRLELEEGKVVRCV
ncbi:hypothetical protein HDU96_001607 [Phlyctochytrium bullatum]|nr:hypothetical protein HDU96_001607 [Phlyctochytrium bullatum]